MSAFPPTDPAKPWTSLPTNPTPSAEKKGTDSKVIVGAASVGAAMGLIVSGPLAAVVLGVGAVCAAQSTGPAADVAKSAGNLACTAGHKAVELDRKHSIVDKTKHAANATAQKAVELDNKHHIVANTKAAAVSGYTKAAKYDEEHHVTEKVGASLVSGMDWLQSKLAGGEGKGK